MSAHAVPGRYDTDGWTDCDDFDDQMEHDFSYGAPELPGLAIPLDLRRRATLRRALDLLGRFWRLLEASAALYDLLPGSEP